MLLDFDLLLDLLLERLTSDPPRLIPSDLDIDRDLDRPRSSFSVESFASRFPSDLTITVKFAFSSPRLFLRFESIFRVSSNREASFERSFDRDRDRELELERLLVFLLRFAGVDFIGDGDFRDREREFSVLEVKKVRKTLKK